MRAGFNSTRRNRNIGTPQAGSGQDNRLVIPSRRSTHAQHWEQLVCYDIATRMIHRSIVSFIIEETREKRRSDTVHACTVDDIATILHQIPRDDMRDLKTFVLRQPERKEDVL